MREANEAAATLMRDQRDTVATRAGSSEGPGDTQMNPPEGPWAAIDAAQEAARSEQSREPSEPDDGGGDPGGSGVRQYRLTGETEDRLRNDHPQVSAAWALQKNLWEGRRVAVGFLKERGSRRRRTDMRVVYGTLVLAPNAPQRTDQIGVKGPDGEVHVIHMSRARHVWDLTRTKSP